MSSVYTVEAAPGLTYDCEAEDSLGIHVGDGVILEFEKYKDCGHVVREACEGHCKRRRRSDRGDSHRTETARIIRHMNLVDKGKCTENEARARSMFRTAQRKIDEHHMEMKLINCHYAYDKSVVIFQFAAEDRIDFRKLVKDLSGALRTRIELRQVGVRDEAAIQGGIGPCGRPFCCATVLGTFQSVNVKMAKSQHLSLNPSSVSGGCGRLKCCLRYEVDGYREMYRHLPRTGHRVDTPMGSARVLDCNALTENIRVRLEEGDGQIMDFPAEELGYGLKLEEKKKHGEA